MAAPAAKPPAPREISTVYGPVHSWRFGRSLGVDPIREISTCSFNCVYCQLGEIQDVTAARREFVPLADVERDLDRVDWSAVDVVTISGSGEPTLAANLAAIVDAIKRRTARPVHILTNATLFNSPEVRAAVARIDVVSCKLDAAADSMLQRVNRPAPGVTLESIVSGILALKKEYRGRLELQIMFMPMNRGEARAIVDLVKRIAPDEVQLNTPRRPYPLEWRVETRGAHDSKEIDWPVRKLTTISPAEAHEIEELIRAETGIPVISVYRDSADGERPHDAA